MQPTHYSVKPEGESEGCCDCCGNRTIRVWGWIDDPDKTNAAYFVQWTSEQPSHGAKIDLIFGPWGDSATPEDRFSIEVEFALTPDGPAFRVCDSGDGMTEIAATSMTREEVIGTPLAPQCFKFLDAIWVGDPRISEIVNWS